MNTRSAVAARPQSRSPRRRTLSIPPLLFEDDDPPPPPPVTGPCDKSGSAAVGTLLLEVAPAPPAEIPGEELPAAYGTGALMLTATEPRSLYAHWDLTDRQQAGHMANAADGHLVVRIGAEPPNESAPVEVPVLGEARHQFLSVAEAGQTYSATLGYYAPSGQWVNVATSAPVTTPPEAPSDDETVQFATLAVPADPDPAFEACTLGAFTDTLSLSPDTTMVLESPEWPFSSPSAVPQEPVTFPALPPEGETLAALAALDVPLAPPGSAFTVAPVEAGGKPNRAHDLILAEEAGPLLPGAYFASFAG